MRAMMITRIAVLALAAGMSPALAGPAPVALVEEVSGAPAGVEFMDYVETGKTIELGARGGIVLSYLNSCVRETISGGTVTVGTDQSDVQGGEELPAQGALRSRQSGADGRQARPVPGQSLHLGHYTCNGAVETTRLLRGPSPDNILFPRSDGAMQNRHSAASANCEPAMCIIRPAPASFKNLI
jgi:hypothetical protein